MTAGNRPANFKTRGMEMEVLKEAIDSNQIAVPGYFFKQPLTVDDAVEFTGIPRASIYQLIFKKKIPCYRPFGRTIFFKKSELEDFLFRRKQAADYEVSEQANAILNGEQK